MPGETYRYGIVFYDTKGRRSSVLYKEDVPVLVDAFDTFNIDSAHGEYDIKKIGIRVNV
jgi:hypothetical protein